MGLKSKPSKNVESEVRLRGGDVTSEASKGAMIDVKSMADYRKEFESHRLQNRHATETEILHRVKEYIKRRIDGLVNDACKKRIMDLTTVTLSVVSSTLIPFSGVAVVVAATVMQCLNFSVTLGLIPLLNVRSFSDLTSMSSQIGNTIKRASKSSLMAGVETAVLEILKHLGLGDWLWSEILLDILVEMIGDSAMSAAWIMTPLLAAPKYMLHRHLIKKMYRKLGDKAHVVHRTWAEQNCVQIEAQTTVVAQVDGYGNTQGTYLQAQEVAATQTGAQVSQTNVYFQQQDGGAGQAQVSQTYAFFQPQSEGVVKAQVLQPNAFFQPQSGGVPPVQVSQLSDYFQQQAPPQKPWHAYQPSIQSSNTRPAPDMVPGYPQGPIVQPTSNSNPPARKNPTLIMGYSPPKNSSFFQPQIQPQGIQVMGQSATANSSYFQPQVQVGGGFQAAAAAQTYTPPPNPTYFQQPYGSQQTRPMYSQPQGNPCVQMGDYNKPQAAPASSTQGHPQGNPYVQMGDYNKMQAPMAYPQAGNPQPGAGYQASAPPSPDLWYQRQAN